MSHYFFDSSALVKRYMPEVGSGWVRSIVAANALNTVVVAQITQAEVISAISRHKREGTLPLRTARTIRLLVDRHIQRDYTVIELTSTILKRAEDLLEQHPLRAYDAIQLASALESNTQLVATGLATLIFLSADLRLLSVATVEGLSVENPNNHP